MTSAPSSAPDTPAAADAEAWLADRRRDEVEARRRRVRADLDALPGLREVLDDLNLYESLDAELDACIPPLFATRVPSRARRRAEGIEFSAAEVERFLRFAVMLRHVKGRHSGSRLIPDLWQVLYVLAPVFGWRTRTGARLFRTLFLEVPRKNGKSTLSSALSLYLLTADSNLKAGRLYEPGAEVYSAATTTRQAREVFRPGEAMARRSPVLRGRLAFRADKALIYERTFSRWEVLSGDPSKAEEKMGLNPSAFVVDEVHVHRDARLIDTLSSATGAREQPLAVYITTAGVDADGTPYTELRDLAEAVATGEIADSGWHVAIWTIADADRDRWDDPHVWHRANPGLGRSKSVESLAEEAKAARRSERRRLSFLRLHLNVRTSNLSRWLSLEDWQASGAFVGPDEAELRGRVAYAGLDLASSTDLAALVLVLPRWAEDPDDPAFEVEVLDVVVRAWAPADSLEHRPPRERALFADLIASGELLTTPGRVLDYDVLEAEAYRLADTYEIDRLHFDRWGSKQILSHLRAGGLNPYEMGQGFASMSPALKELEALVLARRVRHRGNRLLRYAVKSLAVVSDAAGNVKPDRDHATGRIDPFVALVMAVDAWARATSSAGVSAYEERGLTVA
jgi:phage terminase large subunit-like protein